MERLVNKRLNHSKWFWVEKFATEAEAVARKTRTLIGESLRYHSPRSKLPYWVLFRKFNEEK